MNILLYTLIYPPDTCSNSFIFADMTTELVKAGDKVTVITTTPHYDEEHAAKKKEKLNKGKRKWYKVSRYQRAKVYHIDVIPQKGEIKDRIRTFYRFHHYCTKLINLEDIKADVVICQTPPMTVGFDCKRLAQKLNAISVMIVQDLWLDAMIDAGKIRGFLGSVLRYIEKLEYRKLDLITTIDASMGRRIYDISGINAEIIPNFVDTDIFCPRKPMDGDYERYGLSKEDYILSYVGNIGEGQDLSPLIEYAKYNSDARVLIAGNGTREDYYRNKVRDANIQNVFFLGYITREEARIVNSISDVCMVMLQSFVSSTGFPSKMYSLMSMGKPIIIICPNEYAAGSFVEQEMVGWREDISDYEKINKLLDDIALNSDQRKERGENGRRLILSRYSPEIVVNMYKDAIRSARNRILSRINEERGKNK